MALTKPVKVIVALCILLMFVNRGTVGLGDQNVIEPVGSNSEKLQSEITQMKGDVKKAAKLINEIADEIQRQELISSYGSIAYSGIGIAGTGLLFIGSFVPFAAGVALAVTTGGATLGAGSAVAMLVHENVKDWIIDRNMHEATEIFKSIRQKWAIFHASVKPLASDSSSWKSFSFRGMDRVCVSSYYVYKNIMENQGHVSGEKTVISEQKQGNAAKIGKVLELYSAVLHTVQDIDNIIKHSKKITNGEMNEKAVFLRKKAKEMKKEMKKFTSV